MAITSQHYYTMDLHKGVQMTPVGQLLFTGDKNGDVFCIRVMEDGKRADLTGAVVNAYFVRADLATVPLTGTVKEHTAMVTLDSACYAVPGRSMLCIKLALGDTLHTIFSGECAVARSSTDSVVDQEGVVPSLAELLAQITLMEQATSDANMATANANRIADVVQGKLDSGEFTGKGLQILGYYATADALAAGVTAPATGDAYGVGVAEPYDIYVWDGLHGVWVNNGPIQGPEGKKGDQGERGLQGLPGVTAAWNLLDNSFFRKACFVAQAGVNGNHGDTKYVGDRWMSTGNATQSDDYITPGAAMDQRIEAGKISAAKTYTVAIGKSDGTVVVSSGKFAAGFGNQSTVYGGYISGQPCVRIGAGQNVCWAALYEGEYTKDTLPIYIPKGVAAELAECHRYYMVATTTDMLVMGVLVSANTARFVLNFHVTMRATPVLSFSHISWFRTNGAHYAQPAMTIKSVNVRKQTVDVDIAFTDLTLTAYHTAAAQLSGGVTLAADL